MSAVRFGEVFYTASDIMILLIYTMVSFVFMVGVILIVIHGLIRICEAIFRKIEQRRRHSRYEIPIVTPATRPIMYRAMDRSSLVSPD